MVETTVVLLGISFILFFGLFAEILFKKTYMPDVLLLIILGFILGPHGLRFIMPEHVATIAPLFTTFALLFLLYDGAFNIDLASFAKGITKSLGITLFNFFTSSLIITLIMLVFRFDILTSLLTGFTLGGISSAFVIPILNQLGVRKETYSVLTLESAITDVFCIVFALTVLEIININSVNVQYVASSIASLFAIAGLIGIVAGIVWILIVTRLFKQQKLYMITIAYVILVYVITEFLKGNGAIACLFLGLVLRNSDQLRTIFNTIVHRQEDAGKKQAFHISVSVTTDEEKDFYTQISFFLKTFFFVYIGVLFTLSDTQALIIGSVIALSLMMARKLTCFVSKGIPEFDRKLMNSVFARGLAAAAIVQLLLIENVEFAVTIAHITYVVIGFTILLSSVKLFWLKKTAMPVAAEAKHTGNTDEEREAKKIEEAKQAQTGKQETAFHKL